MRGNFFDASTELKKAYDQHADRLYNYALMILADHCAAEDAVQQVFVKMIKMKNKIRKIESYSTYLSSAIRNQCYLIIKKNKHDADAIENYPDKTIFEPAKKDKLPDKRTQLLEDAIKKLSPLQREVLYMKIYENKTFSQISQTLNISINTAASRYRYAIDKLKEIL